MNIPDIINVTDYFKNFYGEVVIKAERSGAYVLILFDSGSKYELEYRWLTSHYANPSSTLGSEVTFWDKSEIDSEKSLFEQLQTIS